VVPGAVGHNLPRTTQLPSWSSQKPRPYFRKLIKDTYDSAAEPLAQGWLAFAGSAPFAMNVSQIYEGDGEPMEMKIDLEKAAN
jgi:hypothetical protein